MAARKGEHSDPIRRNAGENSEHARDDGVNAEQFKAVVKRLLDTPPMHKPPKLDKRGIMAQIPITDQAS
jgi:hypothetical protein